jgi:hypothetical protein
LKECGFPNLQSPLVNVVSHQNNLNQLVIKDKKVLDNGIVDELLCINLHLQNDIGKPIIIMGSSFELDLKIVSKD